MCTFTCASLETRTRKTSTQVLLRRSREESPWCWRCPTPSPPLWTKPPSLWRKRYEMQSLLSDDQENVSSELFCLGRKFRLLFSWPVRVHVVITDSSWERAKTTPPSCRLSPATPARSRCTSTRRLPRCALMKSLTG